MRILIFGSEGSQGKRYTAICKYLGHEVVGYDPVLSHNTIKNIIKDVDRCIIATPIDSHYKWCKWCIKHNIPFLCEKPISKNLKEIEEIKKLCDKSKVDGRMVCNWMFTIPGFNTNEADRIFLNYFNTGKDGDYDYIQPIYLSKGNFELKKKSPYYICQLGNIPINQYNFDISFITMLIGWLHKKELLWSMDDAIKAHKMLMEWRSKLISTGQWTIL
jgi:hypothetical protein